MKRFTILSVLIIFSLVVFSQKADHWIESFENPLDTWSGYTTGTINFQESGAWDFISVYPESFAASWDGSKACRINDDISNASITAPAVNSVGKVSFYYHRPYTGTGSFELQKSVGGGAFTTLDVVDFSGVTTPTYYEYDVNDANNDIRIRIENDDNSAHLTIDYVTLTDYSGGPSLLDAEFSADQTTIFTGTTVNYTDLTSGGTTPYTYEWDLDGDGSFDDAFVANPSFTYNTAGTFDISLRVTDSDSPANVDTETKVDYITVTDIPNLIISEVADPDDVYQARFIELYNSGTSAIDFGTETWYLCRQTNGGSWEDKLLTGSVASDATYVAANNNDDASDYFYQNFGFMADYNFGGSSGNGDDSYFLYKDGDHSTGILVDVYGVINEDGTGKPWEYLDSHAVRHRDILESNSSWTASEWTIMSADVDDMTPNAHRETRSWQGTASSDWRSKGANWDGTYGNIPDASDNVDIPDVSKASAPVINSTATCNNITMAAGSNLEIGTSGALTVLGTFTNNGTLNIKSDATGTGSLIESDGVAAVSERYLTDDQWHFVSNPIDNANTSVFLGLYMKWWDEINGEWRWVSSADSTLAIDMQGYSVWAVDPTTISFTGALNTGTKSYTLTNSPETSQFENPGYNFVGNPYASAVNWNNDDGSGWTRTNMDNAIWIWNHTAGNYGTYVKDATTGTNSVDSIIPQHQAFFVKCNNTSGGSLAVDNAARTHTNKEIFKGGKAVGQYLKINVTGNNYSDEFIINVNSSSSFNFDNQFDAIKMWGSDDAPQIYTISDDDQELSLNALPSINNNLSVPVSLKVGAF